MYIGITVNLSVLPDDCLNGTGLKFDKIAETKGIIYVRKGNTPESLLIPGYELEATKGFIRRLPIEVYNLLNDDFGMHRPVIKIKPRV